MHASSKKIVEARTVGLPYVIRASSQVNCHTTGRKTIENSEFLIEFRPSLEGVSVLRTNCTKLYEELLFLLFSTITMIHDDDNGLLRLILNKIQ